MLPSWDISLSLGLIWQIHFYYCYATLFISEYLTAQTGWWVFLRYLVFVPVEWDAKSPLCPADTAVRHFVTTLFHVPLTSLRVGRGDAALKFPASFSLSQCCDSYVKSVDLGSRSRATGCENDLKLSLCRHIVALHTSIQQCSQAQGDYFYASFQHWILSATERTAWRKFLVYHMLRW